MIKPYKKLYRVLIKRSNTRNLLKITLKIFMKTYNTRTLLIKPYKKLNTMLELY